MNRIGVVSAATLLITMTSQMSYADPCVPQDWQSFDTDRDIQLQICVGNFKYKGGGVANYFRYKNTGNRVADIDCTVSYDNGKTSRHSGGRV
jgi:hypothetical protein